MKKLPALKSKDIIRILNKLGFKKDRQKGSHLVLLNKETKRRVVIPLHPGKDIKKSLLRKIIQEDMGITVEEFKKLLKK